MKRLERLLLQIAIFLIPTNLALHWYTKEAYIHGVLIDYLLPKLYLSDLPILLILTPLIIKRFKSIKNIATPVILLFLYLFLITVTAQRPVAGLWTWFKLIEFSLFGYYLYQKSIQADLVRLFKPPLIAALLSQSILGLLQYIKQSSVFEYILFGEPRLEATASVAKDTFSGVLKLLPYGTTPHPNVLAGFLTTGILLILIPTTKLPKKFNLLVLNLFTICLSIWVLWLTRSQTAMVSISICLIFFSIYHYTRRHSKVGHNHLAVFITLIYIVMTASVIYHSISLSDNSSVIRRYRLLITYEKLFLQQPFLGTGLNQSIPGSINIFPPNSAIPFFQPVHSIYLFCITEIGILGTVLLIWIAWSARRSLQKRFLNPACFPLYNLLIIGLLDHYPVTLQSGQLLLMLSLVLFLFPSRNS